mgnify:CR=1 FL=1
MYNFPKQITFHSDGNVIELVEVNTNPKSKEVVGIYKYIVSKNKLSSRLPLTEDRIETLLKNKLISTQ